VPNAGAVPIVAVWVDIRSDEDAPEEICAGGAGATTPVFVVVPGSAA